METGSLKGYFKACSYSRFYNSSQESLDQCPYIYSTADWEERKGPLYCADATKTAVCPNKRIDSNKVFSGTAVRGKTSVGWFYGWKLFIVVNPLG